MKSSNREEILGNIRLALKHPAGLASSPLPATARVGPRHAGDAEAEIELLLEEIVKLGGHIRRIRSQPGQSEPEWKALLAEIVRTESIHKATLWQTPEIQASGIAPALQALGVEIVSPYADNRTVAGCDLGVTTAAAALPETGTLVLRSSVEMPRAVSLLPRVHLALIRPNIVQADLHSVFEQFKRDGYFVFVTGPSRTSDIELTVTIGVHGPKTLYVWLLD